MLTFILQKVNFSIYIYVIFCIFLCNIFLIQMLKLNFSAHKNNIYVHIDEYIPSKNFSTFCIFNILFVTLLIFVNFMLCFTFSHATMFTMNSSILASIICLFH